MIFSDGYSEEIDGLEGQEKENAISEFLQEEWEGYVEGAMRAMRRVFKGQARV